MVEDNKLNMMHDSLNIFEDISNNQWFKNTTIILFLNKYDLFKEKIAKKSLKICFPDFRGGKNSDNALKYIKQKFLSLVRDKEKNIQVHVTVALDTEQVRVVFNAAKEIILNNALDSDFGL
eukprot:TRINITY_DN8121_c0_g1_i1.p1 TRINITY_DN8121_c0_g1~~TRINITY_DN8121_c0_g1_i1.p1  ORF type:complete len:121 (-),score=18.77 TRINITY_DN8121_c0_g1_i1:124-486(-)